MGLDCSHDAWHGAYSAFMRWRRKLAEVLGIPPLDLMEGFFDADEYGTLHFGQNNQDSIYASKRAQLDMLLPISWACLKPNPLYELLSHSDCDGNIPYDHCWAIAEELEKLIPLLPEGGSGGHIQDWKEKTKTFVDGLRTAYMAKEDLEFH
jgi:hypothetical protein